MAVNISIPSWSPPGETSSDLFIERTNLDGAILGALAYGAYLVLAGICLRFQLTSKQRHVWQIAYTFSLLVFGTIFFGASTKWVEEMFIDSRNFHQDNVTTDPEATGPLGFYNLDYNTPMIVLGNAAYVVLNFLSDGLVIYRCFLIWNRNVLVVTIPALVWLAQTGISIATVWNNSLAEADFFAGVGKALATAWVLMSICLNILLSILIVFRIVSTRSRLISAYGAAHARQYTNVGAIVIESAGLYSFLSLLFLIFYELPQTNPAISFVNIILPLLTYSMCIAPTLIMLRVAREKAFTRRIALASTTGVSLDDVAEPGRQSTGSMHKEPLSTV